MRGYVVYFCFFACLAARAEAATVPPPRQPASVSVLPLKSIELAEGFLYPARVLPKVNTVLLAETDGVVTRIQAPLGESVTSGSRILTISHTDPIYKFAPFHVVSPVNGIVSSLEVNEGTQVSKGQRIASVTDPKKIRFSVEIPASDLSYLSKGMRGTFRLTPRDSDTSVIIKGISPFVDPATGTASCEIEPEWPCSIAPGLIGQVSFRANARQGISIPEHALYYKGEETYVRILEGGKAKLVKVKLGKRQQGTYEVLEGLSAGMVLIERTSRFVADGEAVSVSAGG